MRGHDRSSRKINTTEFTGLGDSGPLSYLTMTYETRIQDRSGVYIHVFIHMYVLWMRWFEASVW